MIDASAVLERLPRWAAQPLIWWKGWQMARRRFGGDFWRIRAELDEQDTWPEDRIRAWQSVRLRGLLVQAFEKTDYYRRTMQAAGIGRAALDAEDPFDLLRRMPLLSRADINAHRPEMVARGYEGPSVLHKTSGSTGMAMRFVLPQRLIWGRNWAHFYRFYAWNGFECRQRRVTLGGRYLGRRKGGIVFSNPSERQIILSTHSLGEESVARYVKALWKHRPRAIQGHPSAIARLVDLAAQQDLSLPEVPRLFVTGETVWEADRQKIEQAFQGLLISMYGHGEQCVMASECECRDGFHYDPFYGLVELVPHGSGHYEIVVTSLWNDVMPFLRYRTGDLTLGWKEGTCACGRPHPRLNGVLGRVDDVIEDAAGQPILPVQLRTDISQAFPWMPAYSLVQRRERPKYTLRIFAAAPLATDRQDEVVAALRRWLGDASQIDVETLSPSVLYAHHGKHRIVMKEGAEVESVDSVAISRSANTRQR